MLFRQQQPGRSKPLVGATLTDDSINSGLLLRVLFNQQGGRFEKPATQSSLMLFNDPAAVTSGVLGGKCVSPASTYYAAMIDAGGNGVAVIKALPLTIVAWATEIGAGQTVHAVTSADTSANNNAFRLQIASGVAYAINHTPTTVGIATGSTTIALGVWYQLVGVWASTTDRRIYVNGQLSGTDTTSVATDCSLLKNTVFGAFIRNTKLIGDGKIDNVSIYNRVLRPAEIMRLYNEPFAGIAPARRKIRRRS